MNFKYDFTLYCGGYDKEDNQITNEMALTFINTDWKSGLFKHLLEDMGLATNGGTYPECAVSVDVSYYDEDGNDLDGVSPEEANTIEHTYHVSGEIHGIEGFTPAVDGFDSMYEIMTRYLTDYIDNNYEYGITSCGVNMLTIQINTCEEI